jgi:hypothetical protein
MVDNLLNCPTTKNAARGPRFGLTGLVACRFSAGTTLLRKHGVGGVGKAKKDIEGKGFFVHDGGIISA